MRGLLLVAIAIICSVAAYLLLPDTIAEPARRVIAVFVLAVFFWAFEIVPLFATSLIIVVLLSLLLTSPTFFLVPFASPVIMLFLGGLVLAQAAARHGVDHFLLTRMLRRLGNSSYRVLIGVLLITAFFSMWISNTASAAMMLILIKPVVDGLSGNDPLRKGLILAVAFGANLGGIGTPIGTPPNAIAMGILRDYGMQLNFLTWMMIAVPLAILLLALVAPILLLFFRPQSATITYAPEKSKRLSGQGISVLVIAAIVILLWLTTPLHHISEAIVALIGVAALTAFRLVRKEEFRQVQWDVLVLMWGGLALGEAVQTTGAIDHLLAYPLFAELGMGLIVAIAVVAVLLTSFISNTATANLLLPIAVSINPAHAHLFSITVALACSFSFAFPISTPPNALAYGTGEINVKDMFKAGGVASVIALLVTLVGFQYVIPLFT
jgi:solute carrier family 13 (sodium-dependent dicarboxylate transporter), member 2/3/5